MCSMELWGREKRALWREKVKEREGERGYRKKEERNEYLTTAATYSDMSSQLFSGMPKHFGEYPSI